MSLPAASLEWSFSVNKRKRGGRAVLEEHRSASDPIELPAHSLKTVELPPAHLRACQSIGLDSPDADFVDVNGKSTDEGLEIAIRDFGVGNPEDELPKISQRFFRASTSSGIQGTGIGLNFVKALIEMHGGTMETSSKIEEGSTFTVELSHKLPVDKENAAAA